MKWKSMENKKSKVLIFANIVLGSTVIIFILAILYIWYRSTSPQIQFNFKLGLLLTLKSGAEFNTLQCAGESTMVHLHCEYQ